MKLNAYVLSFLYERLRFSGQPESLLLLKNIYIGIRSCFFCFLDKYTHVNPDVIVYGADRLMGYIVTYQFIKKGFKVAICDKPYFESGKIETLVKLKENQVKLNKNNLSDLLLGLGIKERLSEQELVSYLKSEILKKKENLFVPYGFIYTGGHSFFKFNKKNIFLLKIKGKSRFHDEFVFHSSGKEDSLSEMIITSNKLVVTSGIDESIQLFSGDMYSLGESLRGINTFSVFTSEDRFSELQYALNTVKLIEKP